MRIRRDAGAHFRRARAGENLRAGERRARVVLHPHFQRLIQRELDGDVGDTEQRGEEPAIEGGDALCTVDRPDCVEGVAVPALLRGLCLHVIGMCVQSDERALCFGYMRT